MKNSEAERIVRCHFRSGVDAVFLLKAMPYTSPRACYPSVGLQNSYFGNLLYSTVVSMIGRTVFIGA